MNKTQTNQSGSVVSFLLIGAILVGLVIGGVFLLQQRDGSTEDRNKEPAKTTPVGQQDPDKNKPGEPAKSPAVTQSPSTSPKPTQGMSGAQGNKLPAGGVENGISLPATGPSDFIFSSIAIAVLVGAVASYLQSVRIRRSESRR